jgi:hypothetical protein
MLPQALILQRCLVSVFSAAAGKKTTGQIEKETNEHRTSNIERPTSNNVFCQFKIKAGQAYSAEKATKAKSGTSLRNST